MTTPSEPAEPESPGFVRLSVYINHETAAAIRLLAMKLDIPITEVIRKSVSLYKFMDDARDTDQTIMLADKHGNSHREVTDF